jgi:hypothetical protein
MPAPAAVVAGAKVAASSKTGRNLIGGILLLPVAMFIGAAVLVGMLVNVVFGGGSAASASGACIPQVGLVEEVRAEVPKWDAMQLTNAAAIMQAASQQGLTRAAQVLGVQTAIQESTLRVLDHGDEVGPDSRGLFQQRDSWGPLEVRMDPLLSSLLFFGALEKIEGWETMPPEEAIHRVQVNERASDYIPRQQDAENIVDAWSQASCTGDVPSNVHDAAATLITLQAAGKVSFQGDNAAQVAGLAAGTANANCRIDVRVLQLIVLGAEWYGHVEVSDLNRLCRGDCTAGAGTSSMHCKSPSLALDLVNLGGTGLSGGDAKSVDFVRRLASVLPAGSGIGQSNCRAGAGVSVVTPGIRQFSDTCHHLHLELPLSDEPLSIQQSR